MLQRGHVVLRAKLSKQTGLEGQHHFTLIYFVYVWRTPPLLQLQILFFTQLRSLYYYFINTVTVKILVQMSSLI